MRIIGIVGVMVFATVYPFLPGEHDQLAVSLSALVQCVGLCGLALVPVGLLWSMVPRYRVALAVLATAIATCVALSTSLVATFSLGKAAGVLTLGGSAFLLLRLLPRLRALRHPDDTELGPAPLYLVLVPILALLAELALAAPAVRWSRDRAIANAGEFIADIEQYRTRHGRYPAALQAQHKDYKPRVVGIDAYVYLPRGDSYNLSFEQPRFLMDRFGTREWVVYNPRDEHRVYSHTAWLLPPADVVEPPQGWYASGETGHAHWRYFWFD